MQGTLGRWCRMAAPGLVAMVALLAACSGDSGGPETGRPGGACLGGGLCFAGAECVQGRCVAQDGGGEADALGPDAVEDTTPEDTSEPDEGGQPDGGDADDASDAGDAQDAQDAGDGQDAGDTADVQDGGDADDATPDVPDDDADADDGGDVPDVPDLPDTQEPGPDTTDVICVTDADCADELGAATACQSWVCLEDVGKCAAAFHDGAPCDDDNACTQYGVCSGGSCAGGPLVGCDDQNPCTDDACDPSSGCTHTPSPGTCDDGNACTTDSCQGGQCVGTQDLDCGCLDDVDCLAWGDGDACNGEVGCIDGTCQVVPGSVVTCDTGGDGPCEETACDSVTGVCETTPLDGQACDDGNACTTGDTCDAGQCAGTPDALACECEVDADCATLEDGNLCNGTLACEAGACVVDAETVVVCEGEAPGPCQELRCAPLTGSCEAAPRAEGVPCDDGDGCTQATVCLSGTCGGGTVMGCDDGDPCTDDACVDGACQHQPTTGACDDGDACTFGDSCVMGECEGTTLDCTVDDPCRVASGCDPEAGCIYVHTTAACDDGDACTTDDTCLEGECAGDLVPCDDGNSCTLDLCDPEGGCIAIAQDGQACDDGNACTVGDSCVGDACGGAPRNCGDSNVCTTDLCDPEVGCVQTPTDGACNDQNPCTADDQCTDGFCTGVPVSCDDGDACTVDACDPVEGGCVSTPTLGACDDGDACTQQDSCITGTCLGQPVSCDDGDPCTLDSCDPAIGCVNTAHTGGCDDGDPCTSGDTCAAGTCEGAAAACDDGIACTADACDPVTGGCTHAYDGCDCIADADCDDGTACTFELCLDGTCQVSPVQGDCDDGDPCTTGDACVEGVCRGATTACDDANPCTADACDPVTGACSFTPQAATCDDADACTTLDLCDEAGGCAGTSIVCDDGNPCTDDSCDPETGCVFTPNTAACDDGDACTLEDSCFQGVCSGTPSTAPECAAGTDSCTFHWKLFCGDTRSDDTTLGDAEVDIWPGCLPLAPDYSGAEFVYKMTATCTGTATVTLTKGAGVEGALDLAVLDGSTGQCTNDSCIGGAQMSAGTAKAFVSVKEGSDYFLVVEGRNGAAGPFTLDVSCDCDLGPGGECTPMEVLPCDSPTSGSTTSGEASVHSWEACIGLDDHAAKEVAYTFVAPCAGPQTFTLKKAASTVGSLDLFVVDRSGGAVCGPEACIDGTIMQGDTAETTVVTESGQNLDVVVDGFAGAEGSFLLTASCSCGAYESICTDEIDDDGDGMTDCADPDCATHVNCQAPPGDCQPNHAAACHEKIQGDTSTGLANVDAWQLCAIGNDYTAKEDVYTWTAPCSGKVTARLDRGAGLSGELSLIALQDAAGSCNPTNGCLASALLGGDATQLSFDTVADTTYYLAVDGLDGAEGPYELSVDCACVPKETDCANSIDDDEDGLTDCDDPNCDEVVPCVVGEVCEVAGNLSCGGTADGSTLDGSASVDVWNDCVIEGGDYAGKEQAWAFTPDCTGGVVLTLTNEATFTFVDLIVVDGQGGVCTNVSCIDATFGGDQPTELVFNAEADRTYYLVADSPVGSEAPYTIQASCTCKPIEVECADLVDDDGDGFTDCLDPDCADSPFCSSSTLTCGELLNCVDACGGSVSCVQGCTSQADGETLDKYLAVQQCVVDNCLDAPPDQVEACVETVCAAELNTCYEDQ